ncbi:protein-export membrane protein, SecD/SecF family [Synechococcus sp. PCC 7502]|uniref:protein translocase subunit SecD n=1 Tax=Synechococcus sp. PCC 7502 TaxID=1173263 RepID=UPI00029FA5D4|nr:protein translocase subunit SecD [Synechococcus sp. PCC 7502]AFY74887.1 protein-export membrane protein, SecD/SecF family [Synechococcus sp. PCC 7502]
MPKQSRLLVVIFIVVLSAIFWIYKSPPRLGLDLRGGAQLTLQAQTNPRQGIDKITPRIMETAKFVVEQRINGLGVGEAAVQISGENQLIVQLPGVSDPAQAERVLGNTAQLEFRKQKVGSEARLGVERQVLLEKEVKQRQLELGGNSEEISKNKEDILKSQEAIADLFETTGLTGDLLKDAVAQPLDAGQSNWQVALTFNDKGGDLFAKITGELGGTGRSIGIFLDNQLFSSPSVGPEFQGRGITGGRAVITGNFTLQQATDLSLQLRAGALPVPIKIVENRTVGATLGADSVQSSIIAGVSGLILVLAFMIFYYRLLGLVADIALLVYAVITFALFSLLGVTLTLPGIAGFILSIGIAVDANVLIFERTKEELLAGKTLYKSVDAGFNRAWTSILDSNVTTLISCGALFWLGSGLVKGFALTLGVGVVVSMFTAITCSHALLLALISYPNLRQPSLYGVKTFGKVSNSGTNGSNNDKSTDQPTGTIL